ncbi:hypothetical protein PLA106_03892 [Pseudomonas amygdali pv. lachrymans str. M302278]|nr:hypothetical protein PLA106_03892 [Pseudomonas amygdali pv. lachrymans str. M302278]
MIINFSFSPRILMLKSKIIIDLSVQRRSYFPPYEVTRIVLSDMHINGRTFLRIDIPVFRMLSPEVLVRKLIHQIVY